VPTPIADTVDERGEERIVFNDIVDVATVGP